MFLKSINSLIIIRINIRILPLPRSAHPHYTRSRPRKTSEKTEKYLTHPRSSISVICCFVNSICFTSLGSFTPHSSHTRFIVNISIMFVYNITKQNIRFLSGLVLGGTPILPRNRGTSFSRLYQYCTVEITHGTTVVTQYHKYRGTTVQYLPTNSHLSENFRAKKTVY